MIYIVINKKNMKLQETKQLRDMKVYKDSSILQENDKIQESVPITTLNKESDIFESRCKEYGFTYQIGENIIFIMTGVAAWYIEFKQEQIKLYHRNPKYPSKGYHHGTLQNDYHDQNVHCETVEAYLEYIYCHDKKYAL